APDSVATEVPAAARLPPRVAEAIGRIDRVFGARQAPLPPREVRQLRLQLEALLGSRERWPTPLLRQLFDALWQRARGRRRSADHERMWLNLAGFCLRPGHGHTLDDWRVAQCWGMFEQGVQHPADAQVRNEWWTLWRRIAGGLDTDAQVRLLQDFAFNLQAEVEQRRERPRKLVDGSADDMLRLAATLERIPAAYKAEIGAWLWQQIDTLAGGTGSAPGSEPAAAAATPREARGARQSELARLLWALGRLGARQPVHGSAHDVLDAGIAAQWLERLLAFDWKKTEPAGFAAAHIARLTGDRQRDLALADRQQVARRLAAMRAAPAWITMVQEVVALDEATQRRVIGESLPPGLKLLD
ncbi:MAG: Hsp70 family protein, partial [Janthinobacterium lividum]